MGEEGVVSYGPNSPQDIRGTEPETVRDEEQDLRTMIHDGMEVYDGEQKKVGKVKATSEPLDAAGHFYVTVERGFLGLGHDLYIPSQYLSVWDDQVGVEVSKGHIDTMGWDQPPGQEASPPSGPPEGNGEMETPAPMAAQETPARSESAEERIQQFVEEQAVERGGGQEQAISDVSYTEAQEPLAMSAAGETEAREEINAGQTPPQREAYATETEAERTEGTGPASREQWEKAGREEKGPKRGSPEAEAEERARGAAPDYTKYE